MIDEKEVTPEEEYSDAFSEFALDEVADDAVQQEDESPAIERQDDQDEVNWQERAEASEAASKDWEHKFHSDAGRVGAMQRKINELEAQHQDNSLAQQPPEQAAQDQQESPPELAEFKEDYPEIYSGVEKYMETELQRRTVEIEQQFQQQLAPVNQMMQQQTTAAETAALNAQHPDWQQLAVDANFQDWVASQPAPVQQMANSDYANEVSYVLDSFKTQTQSQQPQLQPVVTGLAQKREKQLANASTVKSRASASTTPLAEDDYSSSFAYYAAKK